MDLKESGIQISEENVSHYSPITGKFAAHLSTAMFEHASLGSQKHLS
jgi:hypothetical protein